MLFFVCALAREGIFTKAHNIESRKYTVRRRMRALFSPEILQAGAVKGLNTTLWKSQTKLPTQHIM